MPLPLLSATGWTIRPEISNRPSHLANGITGVLGIVVVVGREMGAWGQVELVPLKGKKG
jgi:hypothetical protein